MYVFLFLYSLQKDRLEEEIKYRASADVREELLEEMQLVDLLSNEYSLEEIIYQLARILFSQSLSRGSFLQIQHIN